MENEEKKINGRCIMTDENGDDIKQEIPQAIKDALQSKLTARKAEREIALASIERDYGSDARLAVEVAVRMFCTDYTIGRIIHKSNIPEPIEKSIAAQQADVETDVVRFMFNLSLPAHLRMTKGKNSSAQDLASLLAQTVMLKTALKIVKGDIEVFENSAESIASIVSAMAAAKSEIEGKKSEGSNDAPHSIH